MLRCFSGREGEEEGLPRDTESMQYRSRNLRNRALWYIPVHVIVAVYLKDQMFFVDYK